MLKLQEQKQLNKDEDDQKLSGRQIFMSKSAGINNITLNEEEGDEDEGDVDPEELKEESKVEEEEEEAYFFDKNLYSQDPGLEEDVDFDWGEKSRCIICNNYF